jgi:hypothetical protein
LELNLSLDFLFPVEDLDYDRDTLFTAFKAIKNLPKYVSNDGFEIDVRDTLAPLHIEAMRINQMLPLSQSFSISCIPKDSESGWHVDKNRGCTLLLPLDRDDHLIFFKNDKNEELLLKYNSPVLLNSQYWHNAVNKESEYRANLVFHFNKSYETIKQKVISRELFSSWKLGYSIYSAGPTDSWAQTYFNIEQRADNADYILFWEDSPEEFDIENHKNIICVSPNPRIDHNYFGYICTEKLGSELYLAIKLIIETAGKISYIHLK